MVSSLPGPGCSAPGPAKLRAVIAAEQHQGVFCDPEFLDAVEHLPDTMVHFDHRIREIARTGLAGKIVMRQRREMQLGQRNVGKEPASLRDGPLTEVDRATGDFSVDQTAHLKVVDSELGRGFSSLCLHYDGYETHRRVEAERIGEHTLVSRPGNAVPLVEAASVRQARVRVAQMPLAKNSSCVALIGEQLRQRYLPRDDSCRARTESSRTDRMTLGHQSRSRRNTVAFKVEVEEAQPLLSQLVDAWRGSASQFAAAVAAQLTPSEIVRKDEQDIGLGRVRVWRSLVHRSLLTP